MFLTSFLLQYKYPEATSEIIKLFHFGNHNAVNNIAEKGEFKRLAEGLEAGCNNDNCIKKNFYDLVKKIPYCISGKDRKPRDVLTQNGGDCDEKSFLFVSLLNEKDYSGILVYTKDHTFAGIEYDEKDKNKKMAYIKTENKKYCYAELTNEKGYIGRFNGVEKDQIIGVYDIQAKRKIPLENIEVIN